MAMSFIFTDRATTNKKKIWWRNYRLSQRSCPLTRNKPTSSRLLNLNSHTLKPFFFLHRIVFSTKELHNAEQSAAAQPNPTRFRISLPGNWSPIMLWSFSSMGTLWKSQTSIFLDSATTVTFLSPGTAGCASSRSASHPNPLLLVPCLPFLVKVFFFFPNSD